VGILGEYIGRIYEEVKQRPLYVVRERVGFEEGSEKKEPAVTSRASSTTP
jgi:hypothetical protein